MKAESILSRLSDPEALETLHRDNRVAFRAALDDALRQRPDEIVLRVWDARLRAGAQPARWTGWGQALALALGAGLALRLPALVWSDDWWYPRAAPALVLLALALWCGRRHPGRFPFILAWGVAALSLGYAALLPGLTDSVGMALLHLPLLGWAALGIAVTGARWREPSARLDFLRLHGEWLVLASLLALGCGVFSGLALALFSPLWPGLEEPYMENLGVVGVAALPVAAAFLHERVFAVRLGIAAVLARLFAPLFLLLVLGYLAVALLGGASPFMDRDLLILLNALLVVVLGMTLLSVAEGRDATRPGWPEAILGTLLAAMLVLDLAALSSILFSLAAYGFTPNRVVVLGANLVILGHLAWLAWSFLGLLRGASELGAVRRAATAYLPVYVAWAALVAFLLPWLFRLA